MFLSVVRTTSSTTGKGKWLVNHITKSNNQSPLSVRQSPVGQVLQQDQWLSSCITGPWSDNKVLVADSGWLRSSSNTIARQKIIVKLPLRSDIPTGTVLERQCTQILVSPCKLPEMGRWFYEFILSGRASLWRCPRALKQDYIYISVRSN